ncbi:PIH1 domain-containing protein 1-like [Pomacea canaliculata]|uniref:PIH1 domain-containing protein 1-like n=1 Tax=Pomacea canaliculata TaxID=400727 RepID=UPI000D72E977|nr:PIH1 domain-containing protein 1-like [Pomacea canaliculata]
MDSSLTNLDSPEAQAILGKLLLESGGDHSQYGRGEPTEKEFLSGGVPCTKFVPLPGFCVKLKTSRNEKVFMNICQSENVPPAKDLTDDELLEILKGDDLTKFRVPMSIGEPHAEIDKAGVGCTVYDVVVHPAFLQKIQSSELFRTFFLTITSEGIEEKFKTELKRDWIILKNRKCVGYLQEQIVRLKSKPLIVDMDEGYQLPSQEETAWKRPGLIQEVQAAEMEKKRAPEPKFSIVQEPAEGYPEYLVAEIHLPLVKTAQTLTLDVGEDRILLETRSNVYHLDIYLPYNIVQEDAGAQFDRCTKILTLTMPVQPNR